MRQIVINPQVDGFDVIMLNAISSKASMTKVTEQKLLVKGFLRQMS
jgi:hypothetical protein